MNQKSNEQQDSCELWFQRRNKIKSRHAYNAQPSEFIYLYSLIPCVAERSLLTVSLILLFVFVIVWSIQCSSVPGIFYASLVKWNRATISKDLNRSSINIRLSDWNKISKMAHAAPTKRKSNNNVKDNNIRDNNIDIDELVGSRDGGWGWVIVIASFLIHIISE